MVFFGKSLWNYRDCQDRPNQCKDAYKLKVELNDYEDDIGLLRSQVNWLKVGLEDSLVQNNGLKDDKHHPEAPVEDLQAVLNMDSLIFTQIC